MPEHNNPAELKNILDSTNEITKNQLYEALEIKNKGKVIFNYKYIIKAIEKVVSMDEESIKWILTGKFYPVEGMNISYALQKRGDFELTKEHFLLAVKHDNITITHCMIKSGFVPDNDCIQEVLQSELGFIQGEIFVGDILEQGKYSFTKEDFLTALKYDNAGMARALVAYDRALIGAERLIDEGCIQAAIREGWRAGYQTIFALQSSNRLTKEHLLLALELKHTSIVCSIIKSKLDIDAECIDAIFASDVTFDDSVKIFNALRKKEKGNVHLKKEHFFKALDSGNSVIVLNVVLSGVVIDDECIKAAIEMGGYVGRVAIEQIKERGDVHFTEEQRSFALSKEEFSLAKIMEKPKMEMRATKTPAELLSGLGLIAGAPLGLSSIRSSTSPIALDVESNALKP